jgi:rhamnosyltransferase
MHIQTSAIIIAYFPDENLLCENIETLFKQVGKVFVINNTPKQKLTLAHCEVINLEDNFGIAKAQNIGLELSIEQGFEYSIIFDQDSNVPFGMIESMLGKLKKLASNKVACIGPRIFDVFEAKVKSAKIMTECNVADNLTEVKQIIASGQLLPLKVLSDIGYMDESLFIDAVDHEWCWRAVSKGYKVLVDEDTMLMHRLGDGRKKIFGFTYKVDSPIRLYYQFRNTLRLMFVGYVPTYWKCRAVLDLTFKLAIYSIFGPDRRARISYIYQGIMHSMLGKTGRHS